MIFYLFETAVALFSACMLFFVCRDAIRAHKEQQRSKTVGIRKEFADLYDQIRYASHVAELAHMEDATYKFFEDHKGEKEGREFTDQLLKAIIRRERKLRGVHPVK